MMNAGYVHNRLISEAITVEEVQDVRRSVKVGDAFPVYLYSEESKTERVKVGRVVSKHRNLVCLDVGTSVTYVEICRYLRAKAADPDEDHYIK